jgi:hypothetical protein
MATADSVRCIDFNGSIGSFASSSYRKLAAESQALVDKAMAIVKANANALTLGAASARQAPVEDDDTSAVRGPKYPGVDVARFGSEDRPLNMDRAQARATPVLVSVSSSPAAGVDDPRAGKRSRRAERSAFAAARLRRDRLRAEMGARLRGRAEGAARTKLARSASEVWCGRKDSNLHCLAATSS